MAQTVDSTYFVPALPTLSPAMLLSRGGRGARDSMARFHPFNAPSTRYYYFSRNALWHACRLLNLADGEVIVPAYHHGVEIETLVAAGVRPVYYRVDRNWRVDLADVERLIGPSTRALYLEHYAGMPGPAAEMKEIAERHGLPLIEDCALSLLTSDGKRQVGTTGDVSFFSIYKMLPVPSGGAVAMNGEMANRMEAIAAPQPPPLTSTFSHIMSSLLKHAELRGGRAGRELRRTVRRLGRQTVQTAGIERVTTGSNHFDPSNVGLGMSSLSMRVLRSLDLERVKRIRRRNYRFLQQALADIAPPIVPDLPDGACPLFYPAFTRDKRAAVRGLQARRIEAIDFWRHFHPSCDPARYPDAAWLREHVFEVPCHQDLGLPAMAYIARSVREVLCAQDRA